MRQEFAERKVIHTADFEVRETSVDAAAERARKIQLSIEEARQQLVEDQSTDMSKWRELIERHLNASMTDEICVE